MDLSADILCVLKEMHHALVPHKNGRPVLDWHAWDTKKKFTQAGFVDSGHVPVDDFGKPLFKGCYVTLERESGGMNQTATSVQKGGVGDNEFFGAVLRCTTSSKGAGMAGFRRVVCGPASPVFLNIGSYESFRIEAEYVGADLDEGRFDISLTWLRELPNPIPALYSPWRELLAANTPAHTHNVPSGAVAVINGATACNLQWLDSLSLQTGLVVGTNTALAPHEIMPTVGRGTHVVESGSLDAYIKWELSNF